MQRSRSWGIALASVVLGGGILALGGFALASAEPSIAAAKCAGQSTPQYACTLKFSVFPDALAGMHGADGGPHPDWVSYSSNHLFVPANSTIHVVIDQYDSGETLNNFYFAKVVGTVGGTATVDGKTVTSVDPHAVGHTFTLRSYPVNGQQTFLNVPLPANLASDTPVTIGGGQYPKPLVIAFDFKTGPKGTVYQWNCEYPCGGSRQGQFGFAMSTFGYMSGTMTVE
jgi:hypothetical protein